MSPPVRARIGEVVQRRRLIVSVHETGKSESSSSVLTLPRGRAIGPLPRSPKSRSM